MKNIYDYEGFAERYIGSRDLGCVMVETDSPLALPHAVMKMRYEDYEYHSPTRSYIAGIMEPGRHHTTVRYGFLPEVRRADVETVLVGLNPRCTLAVRDIEVFPSAVKGEDYECVVCLVEDVATISGDSELALAHAQLAVLPNLATFPYKPHVTIGYFKTGFWEMHGNDVPVKNVLYGSNWKVSINEIAE